MSKLKKALIKAKEQREGGGTYETGDVQKRKTPAREIRLKPILPLSEKKELKIAYSNTRVQKVDSNILRRNKIFSLFKDTYLTNQIETLRTQILHQLKKINGNSLLITSARPGEGKTFTSINLAIGIAQQLDRSVLLVDADLRNPWKYHKDFAMDFFGIHTNKGLADYLLGDVDLKDILINPGIDKLTILPAGGSLPNSAELLASSKMEALILETKNRYGNERIVIFDSPAILACTDPLVFSHLVDGIILVVEAEKSGPDDLKKALEFLKDKPLLGTVFNKIKGT